MNERIEQLLEQARAECFRFGSKPATTVGYDELEKFAELIVRECVEVCGSVAAVKPGYNDAAVADTAYLCGDQIKEHFGVE
jgi:hypothetical protein